MTKESFQKYQEETFDSFCKRVIRNEGIQAHRELTDQARKEVQLSSLTSDELSDLLTKDTYHLYCKQYHVCNQTVMIYDPELGDVLQFIPPKWRDIILLYYFLDYSDVEIGKLLHLSFRTVNYRRTAALRHLRSLLEVLKNE